MMDAQHLVPDPGFYGLSAAIGGAEVTPLEAAGIYAMMAADGRYRRPRILRSEPRVQPFEVLSPGAAWLARRTLRLLRLERWSGA